MIQTEENGEKSHCGPDFNPLDPNSGCQVFFFIALVVRNCSKLSSYAI